MNRPNVLILFSDQQRYDTIYSAGFEHMITPNLDGLAKDGELCINAFSGNPVCMPARHDLITGFPARVHGYYTNGETKRIKNYQTPTIGRVFSDVEYRTAAIGKMHFSPPREHHGFSEMKLMEELPKQRQNDEYLMYLKEKGYGEIQNPHGVRPHIYHIPQNSQQPDEYHGTRWVAEECIRWLQKNNGESFMLMCGFIQPHPPWNIPEEYDDLYDKKIIPQAIEKTRLPFEQEQNANWFGDNDTKEQKEKIRKAYYTAVSMVDQSVGSIINYLKESNQYDNTLIIYTSDHGEMLQDKGYYSKELPYDSAVRIPMIIKYPKELEKIGIRTDFVDLLDIFPTCLEVCNIDYPDKSQKLFGKSLLKLEEKEIQFAATGELPLRWVMSCNKQYKYIYHYMGGYEELYRIGEAEINNLMLKKLSVNQEKNYMVLKKKAIEYEKEWGIEEGVVEDKFLKVPAEKIHPSIRGKFHFWSNMQMQQFYEENLYDRASRLKQEMEKALSNKEKSGIILEEVFNEKEWKEQYQKCFQEYTKK